MKKRDLNAENARPESAIFAELSELCQSPGYVHAIAYFCFRDNLITYAGPRVTEKDVGHQYSPNKLLRIEISTLVGLMVKGDVDFNIPKPTDLQRYIDRSEYLLHEIHMSMQKPWFAAFREVASGSKAEHVDPFGTAEGLREPIFYGGEAAYNFQYEALAPVKYHADAGWLAANKGFTIDEAVRVARAVGQLQIEKFHTLRKAMRKQHPDTWTFLPSFIFECQELETKTGFSVDKIELIITAFCVQVGSQNSSFTSLSAFNETNSSPILRLSDGRYILLQQYSLLESLYETPFFWMAGDKSYSSTAAANRGAFVEEFLASRLRRVFGDAPVYQNVDIYDGKNRIAEADVLVVYGDAVIVVQAKSKRLTIEARKGNDLQLKSDFKKAIQDSYDQSWACSNAVFNTRCKFVSRSGDQIALSPKIRSIFQLCVVSDYYPALAAQARQFLKTRPSNKVCAPIVTDVFFVDVVSEMLETPIQFLNYLALRDRVDKKLLISQELTTLGYHLKHNLWLEDDYHMVNLGDDFTGALDIAMTARRVGISGDKVPTGILTRFEGSPIGELLNQIETAGTPELVGLGMIFLQMGSESAKHINDGISRMVKLAAKDENHHDFSIPSAPTRSGFTVHVNSLGDGEARDRLSAHCEVRKYDTKSDAWYGLLLFPESGKIRGAFVTNEAWKEDPKLEKVMELWPRKPMMPLGKFASQIRLRKLGRNDPCRCGSGRKFKKCCLNKS